MTNIIIFNLPRLLVNLTHPALLLFREEEPSDPHEHQLYLSILSHQQDYKAAFVDDTVMSMLAKQLGALLEIVSAFFYIDVVAKKYTNSIGK